MDAESAVRSILDGRSFMRILSRFNFDARMRMISSDLDRGRAVSVRLCSTYILRLLTDDRAFEGTSNWLGR